MYEIVPTPPAFLTYFQFPEYQITLQIHTMLSINNSHPTLPGCWNGNKCFPYHLSNIVKIMFSQPKIQSLRNSPFLPYITAPQPQQVILQLESLSLTVNPFRSEKASFTSSFLFPSENKPNAHDLASNTLPILLLVVLYGLKNLRIPRLFKVAFFSFSSSLIYIQHICIE